MYSVFVYLWADSGHKDLISTVTRLVVEKPVIEVNTSCGPADLHLLVGSWKPGGIGYTQIQAIFLQLYVYVWLEHSYDPPEGHDGQQTYTSVISILSTSLTSVSIFSVFCCSRYVSPWWIPTVPGGCCVHQRNSKLCDFNIRLTTEDIWPRVLK